MLCHAKIWRPTMDCTAAQPVQQIMKHASEACSTRWHDVKSHMPMPILLGVPAIVCFTHSSVVPTDPLPIAQTPRPGSILFKIQWPQQGGIPYVPSQIHHEPPHLLRMSRLCLLCIAMLNGSFQKITGPNLDPKFVGL